ncbi:histidine kinase [Alteribacter lacisalsi]|uniref:Signal transduction histidine-protein kinase/phosphatase DegS n=1 Tax=Alteribacter lacisalsi TaxID=2045244 RepID=A0A2W0H6X8_9BACI|nr:sensor histidine kinase [Alteribacter lacisalsi]PYZ95860.1 histidine kinase [Alteribacter lacisalsi]
MERQTEERSATEQLDDILNSMVETVGQSKEEIFAIGENSRTEYDRLKAETTQLQSKVLSLLEKTERMEHNSRFARNRLAEVSKHVSNYSDLQVKEAYEIANDYQVQLAVLRQEEKQLREKKDNIERRLMNLKGTLEKAETISAQINVVIHYLTGDLQNISDVVADAREMQKFGLKIIEAQEEERKRLSREIHDGPAQTMAHVMLRSELVERIYNEDGIEAALAEIKSLRGVVKSSLAEVRRIIYDLRPMALDDLGLVPTISKYLKNFQEQTGLNISFRNIGREIRLPSEMEVAIFRFIQESVQNAYKHADPKEVKVKIELEPTQALAVIKDDGKGFNPEEKKEGSFGLMGMRERVNMLDGQLTITSKPGDGTLIMVQIPITG